MILRKLFEPIEIKGIRAKNRIIMPPMHTNQGSMEEGIQDAAIDFYVTRAKGGFGMIGIGVIDTYFVPGASSPHALFLMNDRHVRKYRSLVAEVKKWDAIIYGQIGVRRVFRVSDLHRLPKLSAVPESQISEMIDSMVKGAIRVREAGFDALEILGIGGGAVSLFLSKVFNDRTDKWGGSLEGRLRFPLEVLKGIRKEVGGGFPLFFRFHGSEFIPGGYSVETEKDIARALREGGVDLFNVSGGGHGTNVPGLTPAMPRGGFAFLAREIRSAVDAPVAASNRINHPMVAEEILRKGWADLISIGRGSLADPEWANKAQRGEFEDIRLCIACNECLDSVVIYEKPVRCTVNPKVGRTSELKPLPPATARKNVVVIGGGCTGLQAAITSAERGHKVCLLERQPFLGGKWRLAAVPPGREELLQFLLWLFRRALKVGVDIRTGVEASREVVKDLSPDAIILCTGSRLHVPHIPGIDLPHVVTAEQVLEGDATVGDRVVVVGGGGVGTGTALYLARKWSCSPEVVSFLIDFEAFEREQAMSFMNRGHRVTIVEQLEKIGEGLGPGTKWVMKKELELAGVKVHPRTMVKAIEKTGLVVERDGVEETLGADTVVLATGYVPDDSALEGFRGLAKEVHVAGMAEVSGHTIEGIGNAFEVAMSI
ncbi:MAG: FAD-dependent oxidoreductase [Thermodesulfobacteriota bacterium]